MPFPHAVELLYGTHALLELFASGMIIPNGRYMNESEAEKTAKPYPTSTNRKRTHGLCLLSLSVMGFGMLFKGLHKNEDMALITSTGFLIFHGGAALLDVAGRSTTYKVHYPFALGFGAHVLSLLL